MLIISSSISQGLSSAKWDDCNDENRSTSDPCYLGCFKDQKYDRALLYRLIRKNANLDRCFEVCSTSTSNSAHEFKYFSRQWKGQCWCDYESSTYYKHGNSTDCNCEAENVGSEVACIYELPVLINVSSVSSSAAPSAAPSNQRKYQNSENVAMQIGDNSAKPKKFKTEFILGLILILLFISILHCLQSCRKSPSENTDTDNDNDSDKGSDDENNDNEFGSDFDTIISVSQADSCENKNDITSPVTVIDTSENFQTEVVLSPQFRTIYFSKISAKQFVNDTPKKLEIIPPCRTNSLNEISTKLFVSDDIIEKVGIPGDAEEADTTNDTGRNKCISCREASPCYYFAPCGHEVCEGCKEKNFPDSSHHEYSVSPIRNRYKNRGPRINRVGSYACPFCQTRVSRIFKLK